MTTRIAKLSGKAALIVALGLFTTQLMSTTDYMVTSAEAKTGKSGLPLPRYVSLKSGKVNMRVGPGRDYKVQWLYTRRGLPVEIIQEFDNWRKIRDAEGDEGWVLHSLLSGKRTAIVAPWEKDAKFLLLRSSMDKNASISAKLEPGVVVKVKGCTGDWCELDVKRQKGYIEKSSLWGVYPDEELDD